MNIECLYKQDGAYSFKSDALFSVIEGKTQDKPHDRSILKISIKFLIQILPRIQNYKITTELLTLQLLILT